MELPLGDPQFWLVTALVAGFAWYSGRRLRRSSRDQDAPCANCPKVDRPRPVATENGRGPGARKV